MLVGVPKEIKKQEARVGLTPAAAREYIAHGHSVMVETGAGAGIGANDDAYIAVGAEIAASAADVFARAEMIVKVKEPQPQEWVQLREGQILFTYLHLAPDPDQAKGLLDSGVTSIAYETVTEGSGLPLLAPMSEVAGRLSIEAAAIASRNFNGGNGLLMGGVPGVAPARVLVLGGGVVGTQAARIAIGLGADVSILDRSLPRLRQLDDLFAGRARTLFSTIDSLEAELAHADVVIGSVLIPGASAPKLVTKDMLGLMRRRSVIVDVAIDQGGCFETSHATTHEQPTYEVDGVIHYCVANMPGCVPTTSSHALNNATLPYGLALADGGLSAIMQNAGLRAGLSTHKGKLTSQPVAEALGMAFSSPAEAIAA
ncbi:MAG TPA: alanine dehydrogenase [Croceicoccus sp.]|nr:alanine dehydrogenase [Croceicoccus sp.]